MQESNIVSTVGAVILWGGIGTISTRWEALGASAILINGWLGCFGGSYLSIEAGEGSNSSRMAAYF